MLPLLFLYSMLWWLKLINIMAKKENPIKLRKRAPHGTGEFRRELGSYLIQNPYDKAIFEKILAALQKGGQQAQNLRFLRGRIPGVTPDPELVEEDAWCIILKPGRKEKAVLRAVFCYFIFSTILLNVAGCVCAIS